MAMLAARLDACVGWRVSLGPVVAQKTPHAWALLPDRWMLAGVRAPVQRAESMFWPRETAFRQAVGWCGVGHDILALSVV